jgi:hypothetical protein
MAIVSRDFAVHFFEHERDVALAHNAGGAREVDRIIEDFAD